MEKSLLWDTAGTAGGIGDGESLYTQSEWQRIFSNLFGEGVIFTESEEENSLNVLYSSFPPLLTVEPGFAVVKGFPYFNTEDISPNLGDLPVVGTTGAVLVLRVDYAAQTIRVHFRKNTDGNGATPTLLDNEDFYEFLLAEVQMTTAGNLINFSQDAKKFASITTLKPAQRQWVKAQDGTNIIVRSQYSIDLLSRLGSNDIDFMDQGSDAYLHSSFDTYQVGEVFGVTEVTVENGQNRATVDVDISAYLIGTPWVSAHIVAPLDPQLTSRVAAVTSSWDGTNITFKVQVSSTLTGDITFAIHWSARFAVSNP